MLNRLEHLLLTTQMDDWEPLFLLYRVARYRMEGSTLDMILEALVKLFDMHLINAYLVNGGTKVIEKLIVEELRLHCEGRSEEELSEYPPTAEYYFKPTKEGRMEEGKDIYASYYPE